MPLDPFFAPGALDRAPGEARSAASATGATVEPSAVQLTAVSGAAGAATDALGGRDATHGMQEQRLLDQLDAFRSASARLPVGQVSDPPTVVARSEVLHVLP